MTSPAGSGGPDPTPGSTHSDSGQRGLHRAPFVLSPVDDDDEADAGGIQTEEEEGGGESGEGEGESGEGGRECAERRLLPRDASQVGDYVEEVLVGHLAKGRVLWEGDDGGTVLPSASWENTQRDNRETD